MEINGSMTKGTPKIIFGPESTYIGRFGFFLFDFSLRVSPFLVSRNSQENETKTLFEKLCYTRGMYGFKYRGISREA